MLGLHLGGGLQQGPAHAKRGHREASGPPDRACRFQPYAPRWSKVQRPLMARACRPAGLLRNQQAALSSNIPVEQVGQLGGDRACG